MEKPRFNIPAEDQIIFDGIKAELENPEKTRARKAELREICGEIALGDVQASILGDDD